MPYMVNGQIVTEQVILEESENIARDPSWRRIVDESERSKRLRAAAEHSAVDRILIEQIALCDPRPINPADIESAAAQMKAQSGCRFEFYDAAAHAFLERQLRVRRFRRELVVDAQTPSEEEIESFYYVNRESFRQPELYHAAHIVKYVNQMQNAEQALGALHVAQVELERGEPFADVARRYSDCSDKGGDLGWFPSGFMVEEFECALSQLSRGQWTDIFGTPFGFHIALLVDRTPAGPASLDRVKSDIERVMTFAKQHDMYARRVAELRTRSDIRWIPDQQAATG
jgi:parvulin-like peptidyl-prolyl isomerase